MIYPHHQKAIANITNIFQSDNEVEALLIAGSLAHGFNDENSDVDILVIVSDDRYSQKEKDRACTFRKEADEFYDGGYYDGKYISLGYLDLVAKRGNEPTKFALHDAQIAFDKTGKVADYLKKIGVYNTECIRENTMRFVSQLDAWKWYCDEGLKKNNQYLLDLAVSKLILFAGRLILLDNRLLFPYHKWFMKVLENAPQKPPALMASIQGLLTDKSADNVARFYELIKNYKDWSGGTAYRWSSYFLYDVETVWMRNDEYIENL